MKSIKCFDTIIGTMLKEKSLNDEKPINIVPKNMKIKERRAKSIGKLDRFIENQSRIRSRKLNLISVSSINSNRIPGM